MLEDNEKDNILSGTLSGTLNENTLKMRKTADAQLRRKVVELNKRYKNPASVRKVLYLLDGYTAEQIDAEQAGYDAVMSGQPIPQDEEAGRLENRQRQMLYNDISVTLSEIAVDKSGYEIKDPETGELQKMFDPSSDSDKASLLNELAAEYPDISWGELDAAIKERLPEPAPEERPLEEDNAGSDFSFFRPSVFGQSFGEVFGGDKQEQPAPTEGGGVLGMDTLYESEFNKQQTNDIFQPPQQQQPQQQPQQQVKGARLDRFVQGVEDRLPKTRMTVENTGLGQPPSMEGVQAIGSTYPTAEERYPDKIAGVLPKAKGKVEEGKKTYAQSREELKDVDLLSNDYKPRVESQVPQEEIDTYKQRIREVFGDEADVAIAVMLAESRGVAEAVGDTGKKTLFKYKGEKIGDSVGLFQIRTGGEDWPSSKSRPEVEGISPSQFRNDLLHPDQNIRYAKYLVDKEGWKLWSTWKDDTYKDYLNK